MVNRKKPRSEHRVLSGAQSFYEVVSAIAAVSACDQNRINPRASSQRGVSLRPRDYDLEAIVHCNDGMQRFYIKPSEGTNIETLLESVKDRMQRHYNILDTREVDKLRVRRTTHDDIKKAHEVLWGKAEVGKDSQRRITGVLAILNEMFEKKKAASIQATLAKRAMRAEGHTTPEHGRKTTIYVVTKPEWIKDETAPTEAQTTASVQSELASLLLLSPTLAEEILESLWQSKTEKLEKTEKEHSELKIQREEIDKQINEIYKVISSLPGEIKQVEELVNLLHQQRS